MNIDEINTLLGNGIDLSAEQTQYAMEQILNGSLNDEQLGAFITRLHQKGETKEELASLVRTMWANSPSVDVDVTDALDTCGTGGDKSCTFNISTAVALLLSAAGIKIAKHGNRAASSNCGAADVLEALEIPIDISVGDTQKLYNETGFTFLFAQTFHPGMRFAAPVRRALGVPTTFNYLGPLANPYHAPYRMHGIFSSEMLPVYIETLKELGVKRAFVFHGHGGLDEISLTGITKGYFLDDGRISEKEIDPDKYGYLRESHEDLIGDDAHVNAKIIYDIANGEHGAPREIVLLNAAVGFDIVHNVGMDDSIAELIKVIDSGAMRDKIREISQCAHKLTN